MSRTAKRPRGGKSTKASTHMGLLGTSLTIPASPDLMNLGFSSVALPRLKDVNLGIDFKYCADLEIPLYDKITFLMAFHNSS